MLTSFRFVRLLAINVWVGGLIFFAFVLAPTAFHVLPSIYLAGLVVGAVLRVFHVVGLVAGALFSVATALLALSRPPAHRRRLFGELLLTGSMMLVTAYLQTAVLPAMERDRTNAGGDINAVVRTDPARLHFDRLHTLSERLEGAVLFAGLGVLFVLASEPDRLSQS